MVTGNQQAGMQYDKTVSAVNTTPPYDASVNTSTSSQAVEPTVSRSQPEVQPTGNSNSALTRVLLGGLIGATLGSLAGALANRRASQGFNHAKQGVNDAVKTMGTGLSQVGQGVGTAAKSIGEGVGYAIAGSTQEIADTARQAGVATTNAVQTAAEKVDQVVQGAADSVKSTSEATKQAVIDTAETGKTMAADVETASNQGPYDFEANVPAEKVIASDAESSFDESVNQFDVR